MAVDPARAKSLFLNAADLADLADRAAYLDRECKDDAELRGRVEALLAADGGAAPEGDATGMFESISHATQEATEADLAKTQSPSELATARYQTESAIAADSTFAGTSNAGHGSGLVGGRVIAGRYTLVEEIGEGGMGSVYRASQAAPVKRHVALKLIKTGMNSRDVLARFDAERQALALMDHPNIARIYDGGVTDASQPFFVMELVDGVPLTEYCDQNRLAVKDRLELFVAVCQAVQHAHQKGIIHRDLKPSNVLVTEVDGRPTPKVIDFGVAKATEQKLTDMSFADTGAIVGTPTYMSPEQADPSSMDIDTRTDVYALGVMLYELLVGSPPLDARDFKRGAILEMLRMVREVDPPRPSTKLSGSDTLPNIAANRNIEPAKLSKMLRGELDWVVMKALEKDRNRRYDTAIGLARDLQRYLADEVVEARPPSRGYRVKKFVRRHKGSVIAFGAVAASLLIGVVAFAWQARVARGQRDLAVMAEKAEAAQRKIADKARDAEAAARKQTELALTESLEKTVRMTYERAQQMCEDGQADVGLLWMARSLELMPPGATDLDFAIRTSINLWGKQLNTVRRHWPYRSGEDWKGSLWGLSAADIVLSPDGLSVLLVDAEGIARIFDEETPRVRFVLALEADAPVDGTFLDGARFSPDGRFVALARSDRRARVWNAATGRLVGKTMVHEEPLTGVGFDPAGKSLVTTTGTKIHFWNVETGDRYGEPVTSEDVIDGVQVSPDGRLLMTWTRDPAKVIVWDLKSRKRLHTLRGLDFEVYHAIFSPHGRLVFASGSAKSPGFPEPMSARFWETETGQPVGERMNWQSTATSGESRTRPCFRPDGRLIVTGGYPLRMWQVPSGKPLGVLASMMGVDRPVFLPGGQVLLAYNQNRFDINKMLIDVAPSLEPAPVVAGFGDSRQSVLTFSPNGRTMIRLSQNPENRRLRFHLFDLTSGAAIGDSKEVEANDKNWLPVPAFSLDGQYVAIVADGNGGQILDTATGRTKISGMAMESRISALEFSPDGQLLATGDFEGSVRLWNAATGQPVGPPMIQPPHVLQLSNGPISRTHPVNLVRFSPDGRKLLIAGGDLSGIYGFARIWDVATGQPLGSVSETNGAVRAAEFSPDGNSFATGTFQLILWDAATGRKRWTAPSISSTTQLAFTSDVRRILARHMDDDAARLYDTGTGEPVTPLLRHQGQVRSAALSPDGKLALTSSQDRTTRLWDTSLGLPLGPAWTNLHAGDVSFSPDGRSFLMVGDTNGLVRWQIPTPIEGTPERIRLTVEAATRASLDPFGTIQPLTPLLEYDSVSKRPKLSPDPSEPVEKRLKELGGPPGAFRR